MKYKIVSGRRIYLRKLSPLQEMENKRIEVGKLVNEIINMADQQLIAVV